MDHAGASCRKVTHPDTVTLQQSAAWSGERLNVNNFQSPCLLFRARAQYNSPPQVRPSDHVILGQYQTHSSGRVPPLILRFCYSNQRKEE